MDIAINVSRVEAYLEPCQTSMMKLYGECSQRLQAVKKVFFIFARRLQQNYLRGSPGRYPSEIYYFGHLGFVNHPSDK